MVEYPDAPLAIAPLPHHIFRATRQTARFPDRFTVKSEGSYLFLRFGDIDWIEAQGDYVKFHAGPRSCLARMTMKTLESRIDPAKFLRIHRSTFVNIDRIERISPFRERQFAVITRDGVRLRVAGAYRARLKEFYESALRAPAAPPAMSATHRENRVLEQDSFR